VTVANGNVDPGGAVRCWIGASPTILDCRFVHNVADMIGGAICCVSNSSPLVSNCLFIGNSATFAGAVMSEEDATVTLASCTFCENAANIGGAGLACEVNGQAYLENTIIAYSTSGEAVLLSSSSAAALQRCDRYGNAGEDWT
jgi:hypothetical protein